MNLTFCPGHVMGRVSALEGKMEEIRSVFETVKIGVFQDEFTDREEEATTLIGLVRMGLHSCAELGEQLRILKALCAEQEQRDLAAQQKAQYEQETQRIRAELRKKEE